MKKRIIELILILLFSFALTSCDMLVNSQETKVIINEGNQTIEVGESFQFTASVSHYRFAPQIVWTTSNNTIVSVNEFGEIETLKQGTAKITATADNSVTDSVTVTVIGTISTINDIGIVNYETVRMYRLFFSFKNEKGINISGDATVNIIIDDENNHRVYDDMVAIDDAYFSYWLKVDNENLYLASIQIPYSAFENVSSEKGTAKISVCLPDDTCFTEKQIEIPDLPLED